jgi:hypothetical protein
MEMIMEAVKAYYDGQFFIPVGSLTAKKHQKAIVTLLDDTDDKKTPVFGCAKGKFKISDDFDEPLSDFAEYTHRLTYGVSADAVRW